LFVIFSLAALFGRLYVTVIMTFVFGLFQVFGGGYHARTPTKCLLTMIVGASIGNILIVLLGGQLAINIVITVIVSGIILFLTPVSNKRHPVGKRVKKRSKITIRIIVILIIISVSILSYLNKNMEVATISITLVLYLMSLIYAKKIQ